MKRSRGNKARAKRQPSVEENLSGQAIDEDKSHVTIDIEKAMEEFRRLVVLNDEPAGEPGSTEAADRYILSLLKKEGER